MRDLTPQSPAEGLLPATIGAVTLSEVDLGALTLVTPFKGQAEAASSILKTVHGMAWPASGKATGKEGARAIWFGLGQTLLCGPVADPALAAHAALVDQSDAWTTLRLEGEGIEAVLSRLVPVDLRAASFKRGNTIRSDLGHMAASLTRISDRSILILVFRSMAKSAVHDLREAMEAVAARG